LISAQWSEVLTRLPSIANIITRTAFALMRDFRVSPWNSSRLSPALVPILGGYSSGLDLDPTVLNRNVRPPAPLPSAG